MRPDGVTAGGSAPALADGRAPAPARNYLPLLLASYAFGFITYWHFLYAFDQRMGMLYGYQRDLLAGHTEWVADQNRVLGPLLILAFQRIAHVGYESAYQHYMFLIFVAQNMCATVLFQRCGLSLGQSVVGLLLLSTAPLALMSLWWYPWTNLEFVLLLLAFLVDASSLRPAARVGLYACVFAAWMLTKETCFLLPVWLALRYGLPALRRRQWRNLAAVGGICAAMVVVAAGVVTELRHWLWVSGINPAYPSGMPFNTPTVLSGTHIFSLGTDNSKRMIRVYRAFLTLRCPWPLWNNRHFLDWSVGMVAMLSSLGLAVGATAWAWMRGTPRLLALSLLALAYVLLLFAVINPFEGDKLMPLLAIGAYGYALTASPQGAAITRRAAPLPAA